jgi:hypothetical protein
MVPASIIITLAAMGFIYWFAVSDGPIFHRLLYQHDLPGAAVLLLILGLLVLPVRFPLDPTTIALAIARYRWLIAGAVWLLLSLGTLYLYRNHPLSMDEYAASFQATAFANGSLAGRVPPEMVDWVVPREFQGHFLVTNHVTGQLASAYWPGFALLLTPFVWLGVPWVCNPLIVASSLLLVGQVAREVVGEESACGWAILLAIASPAFTLNGISFYSMPAHLLFNLLFVWLLLRPSPGRVFLAGIVGSFALVLHNPFPHLLFSLPWLAWLIFRRSGGIRNAMLLALGYAPLVALLGVGWIASLDALRQAGQVAASSGTQTSEWPWIVRVAIGLTHPFHFPDEVSISKRVGGLIKLWLWTAPFLIFMAVEAANRLPNRMLKLMGASLLFTVVGYFFVPVSQGHGWGDRYSHSVWGVLPILAAAWICSLPPRDNRSEAFLSLIAKGALLSLLMATLLRAWQMGSFMSDHMAQLPPYPVGQPAIVFVGRGYYSMDLVQNDPWLKRQPWVFVSLGKAADTELAERLLPGGCIFSDGWHGWTYTVGSTNPKLPPDTVSMLPRCRRASM